MKKDDRWVYGFLFFAAPVVLLVLYAVLRVYFELTTSLLSLFVLAISVSLWLRYQVQKQKDSPTYIVHVAESGDADLLETLIRKGADVNAKSVLGMTALMFAAGEGHDDVVRVLIDSGVGVNARNDEGATALMFAADQGHTTVVKLLLNAGADVNIRTNDESTALDGAKDSCNDEIIALLEEYGTTGKHA